LDVPCDIGAIYSYRELLTCALLVRRCEWSLTCEEGRFSAAAASVTDSAGTATGAASDGQNVIVLQTPP